MDHKLRYNFEEDAYWAAEPEEITLFADMVVACAENHLGPLFAARKITDELAAASWREKETIDANDEDRAYYTHTALVPVLIASCASSFPPHIIVHERLLCLITNFVLVEKRQIPNRFLNRENQVRDPDIDSGYMRPYITLWETLAPLSFSSRCEWMADVGESWTGAEKFGRYGMPGKGTLAWSGYLAGQVLAAAQWSVPGGHGVWVWRACCHDERPDHSLRVDSDQQDYRAAQEDEDTNQYDGLELESIRGSSDREPDQERTISKWLFNLEHWEIWKASFQEIIERVDDVKVHELVRSETSKVLKFMEELEG